LLPATYLYKMCGIAGIISIQPALLSAHRLKQMTDALAHRGPDGEAYWINTGQTTGFGHRRLAIIDLGPTGAQPMHYANRYTIVYNGEIYNYIELKTSLQQKGYQFQTQSDTEVILAAYDCYNTDCLSYFDGMFAFAIWDEQEQQLFAARDRFGEKPFYYFADETQFVFASEMKALWAAGIEKQMNPTMLFNYCTIGYTQNPANPAETFYSGIQKLPARSFLQYKLPQRQVIRSEYWRLDAHAIKDPGADHKVIEQFNNLFTAAVQRRLRSDVPLGTSLSGGLDSSSVLACIQSLAPAEYKTFSATFPGFASDESAWIQQVTECFDTQNHAVQPGADQLVNDFETICYHQEEPFQSASVAAQYYVYGLAKQHQVKVLLDGQGADEILAGYHKYYHWYWQELFRHNKKNLQHELKSAREHGITEPWDWQHKMAAGFPSLAGRYLRRNRTRRQLDMPDLTADFIAAAGQSSYDIPHFDQLNNILYYNTFINGLEELLRYADRNSMAHSTEVRLPFLNHELVQFVFSLPSRYKIRDGYTKWLLRKSMSGRLPAGIVWRTDKIGFEPPQQQWMQHKKLQEYMAEGKKVLVKKGILKEQVLQKKIQPLDAHAAENYDWRYLVAGWLLR
jgi:asparagine synthase (glutamine-hydrolysing)